MSIEELVSDLKSLTPEQLDQVAKMVHELSESGKLQSEDRQPIPQWIVDQGVRNGWPKELFTELFGSIPDLERASQPPYEDREPL